MTSTPVQPFNAFDALMERLRAEVNTAAADHLAAVGREPVARRDLFDFINAQSEMNIRLFEALTAVGTSNKAWSDETLTALISAISDYNGLTSRVLTRLLSADLQDWKA